MWKPTCAYPGCMRGAASRGKRGLHSTVRPGGRRYFKWCVQHRKGALKDERLTLVIKEQTHDK